MPVRALWGIGPVTEKRLLALGVTTVGELADLSPESLERYLGVAVGRHLSELSRAIDDRPVVPEQEAKSIGHEETFSTDVWEIDELQRRLQRMVDASATALRQAERSARTVTVKLRFGDFTQITRSHTLDGPVDATPAIAAVAVRPAGRRRPVPWRPSPRREPDRPGRAGRRDPAAPGARDRRVRRPPDRGDGRDR